MSCIPDPKSKNFPDYGMWITSHVASKGVYISRSFDSFLSCYLYIVACDNQEWGCCWLLLWYLPPETLSKSQLPTKPSVTWCQITKLVIRIPATNHHARSSAISRMMAATRIAMRLHATPWLVVPRRPAYRAATVATATSLGAMLRIAYSPALWVEIVPPWGAQTRCLVAAAGMVEIRRSCSVILKIATKTALTTVTWPVHPAWRRALKLVTMEPASTSVMHKPAELTALVAIARNSSHRLPQSLPPPRSQLQVWASVTMWPSRLFRDYCLQWLFLCESWLFFTYNQNNRRQNLIVETLCPKGPLWRFANLKGKNKAFPYPHPLNKWIWVGGVWPIWGH